MKNTSRFSALVPPENVSVEIRVYQIAPAEIGYLCSLVEAYDGIGLIRTLDQARGIIECWIMPDSREVFERLLLRFSEEVPLQQLGRDFD